MVGDAHGNITFMKKMFGEAHKRNCSVIIQLGDFGYWEHFPDGQIYLSRLEHLASLYKIPLYWIDGNHENHPLLWEKYNIINPEGFIHIRNGVLYIPRGHNWTWEGRKFVGLGGAWSIDYKWRQKEEVLTGHQYWWPTELIRDIDVERALSAGKIDILLSHDVTDWAKVPDIAIIKESEDNRQKITTVMKHCRPELLIHGHYHVRYSDFVNFPFSNNGNLDWHSVRIEGLAHDGSFSATKWESFGVLNLENLEFSL